MMLTVQGKLPRNLNVAFSGGVDSCAIADFLSRNHNVRLIFVHHGTETSKQAFKFIVDEFSPRFEIACRHISTDIPKGVSVEEHWRNERYDIFHQYSDPVVTGHHLDDCVETWVWSSLHGNGKIIPYNNKNVIRPFRLNRKQFLIDWCVRNGIKWIEDRSNTDTNFIRNHIRHNMMPDILKVNPGIYKVIKKKVMTDV